MRLTTSRTMSALAFAVAFAPVLAKEHWLHIRVDDKGGSAARVAINLPFSVLENLAPVLQDAQIDARRIRLDSRELDCADLRDLWEAVSSADDGEYVTVESAGERVRVAKSEGYLVVKVDEGRRRRGSGKVAIRMPLSVVEALLSGPEDDLNFLAAIKALKVHGSGELVAVNDQSSTVRIWIDTKNDAGK